MTVNQKLIDEFKYTSLFSEYLPSSFNIDKTSSKDIYSVSTPKSADQLHPLIFTMSNFNKNGKRRQIFIPEIVSYLVLVNHIISTNILTEIIDVSKNSKHSLSKNTNLSNGIDEFIKHDIDYGVVSQNGTDQNLNYINNLSSKIKRSSGSVAILYLDISNFYKNIYTHYLSSIKIGLDNALIEYNKKIRQQAVSQDYNKYNNLDIYIRKQNRSETIGILTGPRLSNYIAEAFLSKIDEELYSNLIQNSKLNGIDFVRYVDDYEFFVKDIHTIDMIINIVESTMYKYRLTLNESKTRIEDFPYYINNNLDKLKNILSKTNIDYQDTMDLFDKFFLLEKQGVKGSIRYLTKSIDNVDPFDDKDLLISYLLNILINDDRSLIKVCQKLISNKSKLILNSKHFEIIENQLIKSINYNLDLEVIWLTYLICKIDVSKLKSDLIDLIIKSKNDLAIIILLNEATLNTQNISSVIQNAKSWLLCYELYSKNLINESDLISTLQLNNSLDFYKNMKLNSFTFYSK